MGFLDFKSFACGSSFYYVPYILIVWVIAFKYLFVKHQEKFPCKYFLPLPTDLCHRSLKRSCQRIWWMIIKLSPNSNTSTHGMVIIGIYRIIRNIKNFAFLNYAIYRGRYKFQTKVYPSHMLNDNIIITFCACKPQSFTDSWYS